jgi:hypothetical protein
MSATDDALRGLAEQQLGLITNGQVRSLGLGRNARAHRVRSGDLVPDASGVLAIGGSAATEARTTLSLVLATGDGAALSHTTALAHWGVRGFTRSPIHVVRHRDHGDHPVPGATLHEVRFLPVREIRLLECIPVVSPSLALLQIAGMRSISDRRLERAIDAAWTDRLVSYSTLSNIDVLMSRQGRSGLRRFRACVEERGHEYTPPASNLEGRFAQLLERAGLPPMLRQIDCSDETGWIGRVDFHDAVLPLVVEIQSERFHRGLTAGRDDAIRRHRLEGSGREVLELTDEDLFFRPESVVTRVIDARRRAVR